MKVSEIMKFVTNILAVLLVSLAVCFSSAAQTNLQDKPLEITYKPNARARSCQGSGSAKVRVTFDKSGKVTEVEMIESSSCNGFNKNVIEAARKIKFKPEIKSGEAVTVTKLIIYTYRII